MIHSCYLKNMFLFCSNITEYKQERNEVQIMWILQTISMEKNVIAIVNTVSR